MKLIFITSVTYSRFSAIFQFNTLENKVFACFITCQTLAISYTLRPKEMQTITLISYTTKVQKSKT